MLTIPGTLIEPLDTSDSGVLSSADGCSGSDSQVGCEMDDWSESPGLNIEQATALLDWLENHGIRERQLVMESPQSFGVVWKTPRARL